MLICLRNALISPLFSIICLDLSPFMAVSEERNYSTLSHFSKRILEHSRILHKRSLSKMNMSKLVTRDVKNILYLNILTINKYNFVLQNILIFVAMCLCFGPIYFDIYFNVCKYENKCIIFIFTRNTRNSIQFLGQLVTAVIKDLDLVTSCVEKSIQ